MTNTTATQIRILKRNAIYGHKGKPLYRIHGGGEHKSANSLVNKGVGKIVSYAPHDHSFFCLNDGLMFNHITNEIGEIS